MINESLGDLGGGLHEQLGTLLVLLLRGAGLLLHVGALHIHGGLRTVDELLRLGVVGLGHKGAGDVRVRLRHTLHR